MSSAVKLAFAGDAVLTTTNLQTLASSSTAGWASAAIDNSTNLYLDALVRVHAALASGSPGSDKAVYVYVYGSEDGSNYTDNAPGTEGTLTFRSPTNMKLIGTIWTPDSGALTYKGGPFSVASAFGGILPVKWGIGVINFTGLAFTAAVVAYNGVYANVG